MGAAPLATTWPLARIAHPLNIWRPSLMAPEAEAAYGSNAVEPRPTLFSESSVFSSWQAVRLNSRPHNVLLRTRGVFIRRQIKGGRGRNSAPTLTDATVVRRQGVDGHHVPRGGHG